MSQLVGRLDLRLISALTAAALAASALVTPQIVYAAHASCSGGVLPAQSRCGEKTPFIDRVGPTGGTLVCKADPGAPFTVQYDLWTVIGGSPRYICSHFHSCSWAAANDPQAFADFC